MPTTEEKRPAPLALGTIEARALLRAAAPLGPLERAHLLLRCASAPWRRVVEAFEPDGDLLDVGCGAGLLAHLLVSAGFAGGYLGLDPDARKIERARRWLPQSPRHRFVAGTIDAAPEAGFSQAALLDVLYLVHPEERPRFVSLVARALAPGGLLVALTSGGGPRWKRSLDTLQEHLAVGLGITRGTVVAPCDGALIAALLRDAGLPDPYVHDVGQGYLHGFELVTARRPVG